MQSCTPYLRAQNSTTELLNGFNEETQNPIKAIAQQTTQSERNIQLHHKKHFGYTAKEIARYSRFIKAVALIQNMALLLKKPDWFEVIDQCGYYDQSQLIHDFWHFINLTPSQFLKFQQDIYS